MAEHRSQIAGASEIRALERLGYETAVPLRNTHDIFLRAARSARRFSSSAAGRRWNEKRKPAETPRQ